MTGSRSATMSVEKLQLLHDDYIRLTERFKALWTFHQFLRGICKTFGRGVSGIRHRLQRALRGRQGRRRGARIEPAGDRRPPHPRALRTARCGGRRAARNGSGDFAVARAALLRQDPARRTRRSPSTCCASTFRSPTWTRTSSTRWISWRRSRRRDVQSRTRRPRARAPRSVSCSSPSRRRRSGIGSRRG